MAQFISCFVLVFRRTVDGNGRRISCTESEFFENSIRIVKEKGSYSSKDEKSIKLCEDEECKRMIRECMSKKLSQVEKTCIFRKTDCTIC